MDAVEDGVSDAVTSMKSGVNEALSGGMAFMQESSQAMQAKAHELGDELQGAGDALMQHVPLKGASQAVGEAVQEGAQEAQQMAEEFAADAEEALGQGMDQALAMVGLPKVSNSAEEAGKVSSKTPIQSMDSFKSGSPEPELQKLEELMSVRADSPKPSSNVLELVDLEATPTPAADETAASE